MFEKPQKKLLSGVSSSDTELGAEVGGRLIAMFCHFFVCVKCYNSTNKKGMGKILTKVQLSGFFLTILTVLGTFTLETVCRWGEASKILS